MSAVLKSVVESASFVAPSTATREIFPVATEIAQEAVAPNGFDLLGLAPALLAAVRKSGYTEPTTVQVKAIPAALAGTDLMVSSSTGSGKTAAFMLPALERILNARIAGGARQLAPRVLVLTPTRELAQQVAKAATTYGESVRGLRTCTVLGGMPYGLQLKLLRGPLDILIATPGRLIDHINSGKADLSKIEMLVLDEADRMLDMGFIDDIEAIAAATPKSRQTLMFSATFDGAAAKLAANLLKTPQRIEITSHREAHTQITQRLHWADDTRHKTALLDHLLRDVAIEQAIVFTSTQRDADWLAERLAEQGHSAAALHGGMTQGLRNRTLGQLRTGRLRMLIATDVAARGIDVPTISHVINFGLPMSAEDYVHRIGRTGRAGRSGLAITLAAHADVQAIRRIERFTTQPIAASVIEGLEPKRAPAPSSKPRGFGGRGRPEGGRPEGGRPEGNRSDSGRPYGQGKPAPRGAGYAGRVHASPTARPASAHPGSRGDGPRSAGPRPGPKGRPTR